MEYYILTKTGGREINEDCAGVTAKGENLCAVLADGLGGHGQGEVASGLVTEQTLAEFSASGEGTLSHGEQLLEQYFQASQKQLLALQAANNAGDGMKTTLVIFLRTPGRIQWGHIGDSRLYYFKKGRLVTRTLDHSVPQMLAASGKIKEKDIRGHEDRNRLLRVMGTEWTGPQYELGTPVEEQEGQAFLLCSDGFWELIEEKRMIYHLKRSRSPGEWLKAMEQEVLLNGRGTVMDNYTAIGIFGRGVPAPGKRFWLF